MQSRTEPLDCWQWGKELRQEAYAWKHSWRTGHLEAAGELIAGGWKEEQQS